MNAVSFLSCCFKMEKTHSERLSATKKGQKTKQKFAKIFDRARKGTENDAQKCLQFPPFCVTLFDYAID